MFTGTEMSYTRYDVNEIGRRGELRNHRGGRGRRARVYRRRGKGKIETKANTGT